MVDTRVASSGTAAGVTPGEGTGAANPAGGGLIGATAGEGATSAGADGSTAGVRTTSGAPACSAAPDEEGEAAAVAGATPPSTGDLAISVRYASRTAWSLVESWSRYI